jgi:hypothetical protein
MRIAVPAPVGPLPAHKLLRDSYRHRLAGPAKSRQGREHKALLGRVPALSTGDLARSGVAIGARNPVQGVPRSRDGPGLTGGYAEFHKRDHPPERAAPFRVRVAAEAAVWALTREQSTDQWTGHQVWRGVRDGVPEQVAAGQPAHRRLVGGQQPPDWVDIGNAGLRSSPRRHSPSVPYHRRFGSRATRGRYPRARDARSARNERRSVPGLPSGARTQYRSHIGTSIVAGPGVGGDQ